MPGYENTVPSKVLLELMTHNLRSLGVQVNNERRRSGRGSTDFGNVSRRVPGPEARIAITDVIETPAIRSNSAKPPALTRVARQCCMPRRPWR
jgi:metal-dependent amidase/aminoacylase/carboxypeptidase family protein